MTYDPIPPPPSYYPYCSYTSYGQSYNNHNNYTAPTLAYDPSQPTVYECQFTTHSTTTHHHMRGECSCNVCNAEEKPSRIAEILRWAILFFVLLVIGGSIILTTKDRYYSI
ncbi:hypothetical protein BS50DRAFT_253822 [Corynespora cassiicola Philippines]|uniref:Uncharacterized protein n=1 Tax=Corynespora cassiicola Philippines TaxID=1448308 RepID=A0A2T2P4G8_CORCC|nr:hypothetical protein BS50DRAFT_253822 [Corynespora cassiicola Philippines]